METQYLQVQDLERDGPLLDQAAALLREGQLVAFPTETVYGLGGNASGDQEILLMPLWGQAPGIIGLYWGEGGAGQVCYPAQSYGDIQRFSLQTLNYDTQLFLAGTALTILGEKG